MDRIRKLYLSFTKAEARYLQKYLTAFHAKGRNRALELLEKLEANPSISNKEMAEDLYGDPRSKAFSMLKTRLYEKMLEVITLSINFQNNPRIKEDPEAFQVLQVQKMVLYANFLKRRGLVDLSNDLFEKAARSAEELGDQVERLTSLISLQNSVKSLDTFREELTPQVNEAREMLLSDVQAIQIFDEFRLLRGSRSSVIGEELDFLENKITELEERLRIHPSPRANYYLYSLKFDQAYHLQKYGICRQILEEVDELFKKNPGLGAKNRLAAPYIKLSIVELNTGQYQQGYEAANEAIKLINPRRHNYRVGVIYKCFACIFLNKLEEGMDALRSLEKYEQHKKGLEYGIVVYLRACIFFFQNKPRYAYHTLLEASELMQDKEGWNVGMRIFEIMLLVELEKLDLISNRLDSLRKHLSKYEVENRMVVIYRVLVGLEKNHFDFTLTREEIANELEKLREGEPWIPVNHEVVRFDEWFEGKLGS